MLNGASNNFRMAKPSELTVSTEPANYTGSTNNKLLVLSQEKPNYSISFYDGKNKKIGLLDFNGDSLRFDGNAEESAKVFFDYVAKCFSGRLAEERAKANVVAVVSDNA